MKKLDGRSMDLNKENIEKLKELFPSIVTDGKIDFDMLKTILGEEVDSSNERYSFTWNGKYKTIKLAQTPSSGTLIPCKEKSVNWDITENIYIEGDNLEVLKQLQKTYSNKIKMIYIDPPYNTGSDFVYADDFSNNIENYKNITNQAFRANPETSGRYHTDWINMIYARLNVVRNLLTEDGVIFISIDDTELTNLKKVCDEIFGANNFVCNFVRKNKAGSGHDSNLIAIEFDYILCYAKSISACKINQEKVDVEKDDKYKFSDEYIKRRGKYYLRDLDYRGTYSVSGDYPIITPDGTIIYAGGAFGKPNTWRWSKAKFEWGLKNEFIVFKKNEQGWKAYIKQYQYVDNCDQLYERTNPYRALIDFSNGQGSIECGELLGNNVFSYPKSVELLQFLLKVGSDKDSIILDFFSGSATTAHAVMQLNAEDGGNRKYILVQLPELCNEDTEAYKAGYKTICEIGEERIRRAGNKIKKENPLTTSNLDTGFKVFKLDSTNIRPWDSSIKLDEISILDFNKTIKEDRKDIDVAYEIMLKYGVFDKPLKEIKIANKSMYSVGGGT